MKAQTIRITPPSNTYKFPGLDLSRFELGQDLLFCPGCFYSSPVIDAGEEVKCLCDKKMTLLLRKVTEDSVGIYSDEQQAYRVDRLREELQLHRGVTKEFADFMLKGVAGVHRKVPTPIEDMTDQEVLREVYEMRESINSLNKLRNGA